MRLKELRVLKNKTQEEVANELNIPRTKYARYEYGTSEPNFQILTQMADYFKVTIDYLLDHEVKYQINKFALTENQLELFEIIKTLSNEQCMLLEAYAKGLIKGAQERQENIEKFKRGI